MTKAAQLHPLNASKQTFESIPYSQHTIEEEEIQAVVDTLHSDWLTSGPKTLKFEKEFAKYIGCKYAIAVNSCTAALHLALRAMELKAGDEVITTPLTFCATTEVIEYQQARPVFVDIDPATFNMDAHYIEDNITPHTRAIMPVHYGGIPCNLSKINAIAHSHGLGVIEDAAHAVGAVYKNKKIGANGNLTAFSFYPTKNMTTAEGGVVTTNNASIAEQLKILSLHGISKDAWKRYSAEGQWYYKIDELGYKYNFTDLQAALGLQQLKKLDSFNERREQLAKIYFEELKDIPEIQLPKCYSYFFSNDNGIGTKSSWHLFVLMITKERLRLNRNQFINEMKQRGVGASVHFIPLHLQPYYKNKYGFKKGNFPICERIYDRILSIPLYPKLTVDQIYYIIDVIKEIVAEYRR